MTFQAMVLAASQPDEYSRIMHDAHLPIAAFGGTFLMMVGLSFFFDHEKDVHWVRWLESKMQKYATIRGIVAGWPQDFAPDRALAAGFTADPDFQSIIRAHIRDTADAAG